MLTLIYILALGPAHWPVSATLAYAALYELLAENLGLWALVAYGLATQPERTAR